MRDPEGPVIDLNRGIPPSEAIPAAALGAVTARLAARPDLFQYPPIGGYLGDEQLRRQIADRYGEDDPHGVFVGNGSLQLLDLVAALLLDDGPRLVMVEAPSYDRAIGILARRGADLRAVPVDHDGIDVDRVEALACRHPRAVLYLIPDFQNPSGVTLVAGRRRRLAEVAERHGLTVVEDVPYRELRYRGTAPPLLRRLAPSRVITLGSFSKTLAPGLRIGFALGGPTWAAALARHAENVYLAPSPLCQAVAAAAMAEGLLARAVADTIRLLAPRCAAAVAAVEDLFPGALLAEPDGGYFLALDLAASVGEDALMQAARDRRLILSRGSAFMLPREQRDARLFLRLPFQALEPAAFAAGASRLRDALNSAARSG